MLMRHIAVSSGFPLSNLGRKCILVTVLGLLRLFVVFEVSKVAIATADQNFFMGITFGRNVANIQIISPVTITMKGQMVWNENSLISKRCRWHMISLY